MTWSSDECAIYPIELRPPVGKIPFPHFFLNTFSLSNLKFSILDIWERFGNSLFPLPESSVLNQKLYGA